MRKLSAKLERCETAGECEASLRGVPVVLETAEEEVVDRKGPGLLRVELELDCGSSDDDKGLAAA